MKIKIEIPLKLTKLQKRSTHHRHTWYGKTACGLPARALPKQTTTYKEVTCITCLEKLFEVEMAKLKWIKEELLFQRALHK